MKQRLTIVHVTSSLGVGGAEEVLSTLVCNMSQANHHVIYLHDGPHRKKLEAAGIPCYQVRGFLWRYDPVLLFRVYKRVKTLQPDCLHTLLWVANVTGRLVGRLLHVPVVSVFHNNVDQDGRFRNFIDRQTLRYATSLVAVSGQVCESLCNVHQTKRAIAVIHNGIAAASMQYETITRATCDVPDDAFVIGSVGRFAPVKRYDLLLDSFAMLCEYEANVYLMLVGVGACERALREQAERLGITQRVRFVVGKKALPYYHLFDLFVLTSDKEGVSIALLEAMAAGVPPLVTHVGMQHPVVQHERDGWVVPAGDKRALVSTMRSAMHQPDELRCYSDAAKRRVYEQFSAECMVKNYWRLFRSVGEKSAL